MIGRDQKLQKLTYFLAKNESIVQSIEKINCL